MRRLAIALVPCLLVVGGACTEETVPRGPAEELSGTCGLPTPEPDRDESIVPRYFLPEGAEISNATAERGGFLTAINVPLDVQGSFDFYRDAVKQAGYEMIQSDNEGFEAELYLRKGKRLAAIQIRQSKCSDRTIAFVNEIVPER